LEKDINMGKTVDAVTGMDVIKCYDLSFRGYVTRGSATSMFNMIPIVVEENALQSLYC
jgi:hypothetical protein